MLTQIRLGSPLYMNISGKVIAITGAAQGLGLSTALHLAQKGARLALIDMNSAKLEEAVQLCNEAAGGHDCDARAYTANIANEEEVIRLFDSIGKDFGSLHGLVNNAGITRDAMFIKVEDGKIVDRMSMEQWQAVIDVNLTGVFLCAREAAAKMLEFGTEGVLVNLASISKSGNMGQTNYSAAKAGVEAMSVTWAKELARYGIRSATIAPGCIETEMLKSMKPEALERFVQQIPLKRLGKPDNIAQTVAFILENDYISGRTIEVDAALRI